MDRPVNLAAGSKCRPISRRSTQIYFDVLAVRRPIPPVAQRPDPTHREQLSFKDVPSYELRRLFRQDVSAACRGATGACVVDINPMCDPASAAECIAYQSDADSHYAMATGLTIEHKVSGDVVPARNIDARLAALAWRIPPHVSSLVTEVGMPPGTNGKKIVLYLPITMGEEDLQYLRVRSGNFTNPDTGLADEASQPTIDFKSILFDEKQNVELARIRQTIALCGFSNEIFNFIDARLSEHGQIYTGNYLDYWRLKIDAFQPRCDGALEAMRNRQFYQGGPTGDCRHERSAIARAAARAALCPADDQRGDFCWSGS